MARMVVVLMVAVSCGLFDTPQQTQQTELDELIQNVPFGETVQVSLSATWPSWDLPTVLANSDVIVEGRVTTRRAEATGLPYHVSTRLGIVVSEIWLDRRASQGTAAATLERVVVRQPGGRLEYRGRFIEVTEDTFAALPVGTDLVLFLTKGDGGDLMEIVDGPYGAFVKEGQSIKTLLPTWHELRGRYDGLDRGSFKLMVAKALAEAR